MVDELKRLGHEAFQDLVRQQVAANRYVARALLEDPTQEPDPVTRALSISQARHGLPWWLYEAQYRRLRSG